MDLALAVTHDWPKRLLVHITCFGCGNKGHYQVNCLTNPVPYCPENKPVTAATVEMVGTDNEGDGF